MFTFEKISHVVEVMCKKIRTQKINKRCNKPHAEDTLRKELFSCIISSQIKFETAQLIMENISYTGLLEDKSWELVSEEYFYNLALSTLKNLQCDLPNAVSHRFPKATSYRMSKARIFLLQTPLTKMLSMFGDTKELRRYLIENIAGIGPKQASMFLRNSCICDDIAVLDTHTIKFINLSGMHTCNSITSLKQYEHVENSFCRYASDFGVTAGILDLAVWVTMKAAQEIS